MKKEPLIEFPSLFPIKVMGVNRENLLPEVIAIVSAHSHSFNPDSDIQIKPSAKENYISITVTIVAESQEQLDKIYTELHKHELVKMTL